MCHEREELIDYVYDEGDDDQRRRIERHLSACESCRHEIESLRRVRHDLLAWDVPRQESVWRPFVPVTETVWWRQVPVSALAAAASVVFLLGAAGGAVVHAVLPERTAPAAGPPAAAAVVVPPVDPVSAPEPSAVTAAELAAVEARILGRLEAGLGARIGDAVSRQTAQSAQAAREEAMAFYQQVVNDIVATNENIDRVRSIAQRNSYLRNVSLTTTGQ